MVLRADFTPSSWFQPNASSYGMSVGHCGAGSLTVLEKSAMLALLAVFVLLNRCFPAILNAITVVKPETVIRWHRRGFRAYWPLEIVGRYKVDYEIRDAAEVRLVEIALSAAYDCCPI